MRRCRRSGKLGRGPTTGEMNMGKRAAVLAELAEMILAVDRPHPVRVAIDGCSAAGKTTLADELAQVLRDRTDREIIREGIDYFKRAAALRTAYPIDSPEGYYLDTWDNDAIRACQIQRHLARPAADVGDPRIAGNRAIEQAREHASLRSFSEGLQAVARRISRKGRVLI